MKPFTVLLSAASIWSLARATEDPGIPEDFDGSGESGGGPPEPPVGLPTPVKEEDYVWEVTNWQAGLSHGNPNDPTTGWYSFNVSATAIMFDERYVPGFDEHCAGSAMGSPLESDFVMCGYTGGGLIAARVFPSTDSTEAHVAIEYTCDSMNITGFAVQEWARERPPYNFTIDHFAMHGG
ncbi:hypothetical protein C7G91_18800 [Acinetobacter nosocomialis]|nr:hypothetical protein C7G91_18800 [Acinetobacter nosocomialis]